MPKFVLSPLRKVPFRRTIRLEGRAPRLVIFEPGQLVHLDRDEAEFMQQEIAAEIILPNGKEPKPPQKKQPPILDPSEDNGPPDPWDLDWRGRDMRPPRPRPSLIDLPPIQLPPLAAEPTTRKDNDKWQQQRNRSST